MHNIHEMSFEGRQTTLWCGHFDDKMLKKYIKTGGKRKSIQTFNKTVTLACKIRILSL